MRVLVKLSLIVFFAAGLQFGLSALQRNRNEIQLEWYVWLADLRGQSLDAPELLDRGKPLIGWSCPPPQKHP